MSINDIKKALKTLTKMRNLAIDPADVTPLNHTIKYLTNLIDLYVRSIN